MTLRDRSDGHWTHRGLVGLVVELETRNAPEEEQQQIAILTMRGPGDTLQRVVLSEEDSRELGAFLVGDVA